MDTAEAIQILRKAWDRAHEELAEAQRAGSRAYLYLDAKASRAARERVWDAEEMVEALSHALDKLMVFARAEGREVRHG